MDFCFNEMLKNELVRWTIYKQRWGVVHQIFSFFLWSYMIWFINKSELQHHFALWFMGGLLAWRRWEGMLCSISRTCEEDVTAGCTANKPPSKVYPKRWWFNKASKKEPPPSRDLHLDWLLIDVKNSNQTLDLVDAILDDLSLLPGEIMDKNPWQVYSKPNQYFIPLWFGKNSLSTLGYLPQILCGIFFVREILHIRIIAVYYLGSFGVMQKVWLMFGRNSQSWMQVCKSMVPWGFPTLYSYILLHVRCWTLLHNSSSPCCWFFRKEKNKALPMFNGRLYSYIYERSYIMDTISPMSTLVIWISKSPKTKIFENLPWYCWWKRPCTTWEPCKSWDIHHINWLAGFLPSTVLGELRN